MGLDCRRLIYVLVIYQDIYDVYYLAQLQISNVYVKSTTFALSICILEANNSSSVYACITSEFGRV
jgi:hypothetical protein